MTVTLPSEPPLQLTIDGEPIVAVRTAGSVMDTGPAEDEQLLSSLIVTV